MIKIEYDIKKYRRTLKTLLKEDDTVIELGCHIGNTSKIIAQKISEGKLIALDKSCESEAEFIKIKTEFDNVDFICGDVRLHETIKETYEVTPCCDVLSIDLGGGYHPDTVFKVYYIWSSVFKPRDTVIRNKGLIDFVNTSQTTEDTKSEYGYLDSHGDEGIPPLIKEFGLWSYSLKEKESD